ncbi:MAG: serine/threonine-protein kinase [Acidobacteriota bacterium]
MDDRTIPIDPSNAPTADASVAPLPHAVAPGDAFGPYRVVRALGAGGFGAVFLATHPILGEVALKILRRGSSESLQRFVREGTLVLDHPAIPRILDQGEVGGVRYLAQSYVAGRSLERVLRDRPMTEAEAIALGSEIAGILAYTHERGVIHCDLKPQNILLDDAGRVHVLDFGIARIRSLADGPDADAGTPGYFAPEQALGQEVGPPTDLHALGIVLYEAATGRLPYEAESPVGQIAALIHGVAVPAGLRRADLSPAFQALLMRLLAKDAAERPQSAAEVGRTLDLLASGVHPAGRFVAIARLRAGSGGVLEIAGGCREDREEVIASLALEADRFGVAVVSGTGEAVAYGALSQALGPLVELPAAPTRQDVLASFRRRLLGRCRERPLALVLRAAHQLDDGTLALVEQMAPSLPSIPLLVVLAGPATDGSVAALCGRLQPTGVLTRIALPGPAGAPDEDDAPDVAPREIRARAREARRRGVLRLALALFESYLATGDGEGRQEALTQAATLLRLTRRFSEARARLEELRAAFPHDRVSWGRATLDLAIVEHESGSRDAARSLVLDAIDAASSVPDPVSARLHASCQLLLGTIEARAGRHVEALACTERALTHVMNPGEKHNRVRVLNNRGATSPSAASSTPGTAWRPRSPWRRRSAIGGRGRRRS